MQNILKNKIVIGVGVAVLGLLVYYFYFSGPSAPLLSSDATTASPGSQELLTTLGNLHTLKLDSSLFTDPSFESLTDFGVTIPPQSAGRRNPFASLGAALPAAPSAKAAAPAH